MMLNCFIYLHIWRTLKWILFVRLVSGRAFDRVRDSAEGTFALRHDPTGRQESQILKMARGVANFMATRLLNMATVTLLGNSASSTEKRHLPFLLIEGRRYFSQNLPTKIKVLSTNLWEGLRNRSIFRDFEKKILQNWQRIGLCTIYYNVCSCFDLFSAQK